MASRPVQHALGDPGPFVFASLNETFRARFAIAVRGMKIVFGSSKSFVVRARVGAAANGVGARRTGVGAVAKGGRRPSHGRGCLCERRRRPSLGRGCLCEERLTPIARAWVPLRTALAPVTRAWVPLRSEVDARRTGVGALAKRTGACANGSPGDTLGREHG
jgi:hypothetical protein